MGCYCKLTCSLWRSSPSIKVDMEDASPVCVSRKELPQLSRHVSPFCSLAIPTQRNHCESVSSSRLEAWCRRSNLPIFLSDGRFLSFMAINCAGCSIPSLALLFILRTEGCESMAPCRGKSEDQESDRACWIVVSFERLPLL